MNNKKEYWWIWAMFETGFILFCEAIKLIKFLEHLRKKKDLMGENKPSSNNHWD